MDLKISSAIVKFEKGNVCGYEYEWGTHDVGHADGSTSPKLIIHIFCQAKPKFGEVLLQAMRDSKISNKNEIDYTPEFQAYDIVIFNVAPGTEESIRNLLMSKIEDLITKARAGG